ncbi:unnamed protein product [Owenia fusiformis]|uniref:Uncharacterized protein n=1 Tax=Owenia fusiformis TaxID=6347 RepID=A0A8S4Q3E8_OWEFU|nr:unnamed protein product [Owenia fusiformis]
MLCSSCHSQSKPETDRYNIRGDSYKTKKTTFDRNVDADDTEMMEFPDSEDAEESCQEPGRDITKMESGESKEESTERQYDIPDTNSDVLSNELSLHKNQRLTLKENSSMRGIMRNNENKSDDLRNLVLKSKGASLTRRYCQESGMRTQSVNSKGTLRKSKQVGKNPTLVEYEMKRSTPNNQNLGSRKDNCTGRDSLVHSKSTRSNGPSLSQREQSSLKSALTGSTHETLTWDNTQENRLRRPNRDKVHEHKVVAHRNLKERKIWPLEKDSGGQESKLKELTMNQPFIRSKSKKFNQRNDQLKNRVPCRQELPLMEEANIVPVERPLAGRINEPVPREDAPRSNIETLMPIRYHLRSRRVEYTQTNGMSGRRGGSQRSGRAEPTRRSKVFGNTLVEPIVEKEHVSKETVTPQLMEMKRSLERMIPVLNTFGLESGHTSESRRCLEEVYRKAIDVLELIILPEECENNKINE